MSKSTQLKTYPEFSRKLMDKPVKNGCIFGFITAFAIILIANIIPIKVDILILAIVVPIAAYKAEKHNLSKYKNPPTLDNLYKFYLHFGLAMGSVAILIYAFFIGYVISVLGS